MRKIFSIAMAAVLLMAGCVKEEISLNENGGKVKVTFTASLPMDVEISRAGQGELANQIHCAIYNEAGGYLIGKDIVATNKVANLELELIKGETYKVAFWAQAANAPYTFDNATATVQANYSAVVSSNEALDAFYAIEPALTISGPVTKQVTLTRPFAQINLGVPQTEIANAATLGVNIDQAQVKFTNVATKLDLFSGEVSERQDVTFGFATLPSEDLRVNNVDYKYLAFNYVFVKDTDVTDLTYTLADGTKLVKEQTVPAVNFKRNHRTNILGRLITGTAGFDITIDPGELPDHESVFYQSVSTASGLQSALNDDDVDHIVLTGDIDLNDLLSQNSTRAAASAGLTIAKDAVKTIDLGGYTLSWANGDLNSSMIQNNGTLTIQNGDVVYTYQGAGDPTYGAGNYAINNSGTLTIDANITVRASQKAEGEKISHALYAVQGSGNITINGGKIYNHNNIAVRIFANTTPANLTINGGELKGVRAIWVQLPSNNPSVAPEVTVNINGGKLISVGESGGYKLAIYSYSYGNSFANVTFNIAGGEFDGDVALTGATNKTGIETVNISGGKFSGGVYSYADDALAAEAITITGGEFSSLEPMVYLNEANEVLTLGQDIALESTLTLSKDLTLDLNGHTLSGVCNAGQGHLIMVNNGATLNVKDTSDAANGKITFAQGTSNTGWTIDLEGELNLYSGTIELTGDEWSIGYAVDVRPNAWGTAYSEPTTFNMYGGKLLSSDGAVRVASSSDEEYTGVSANFNMEDGEIEAAWDGVFFQQSNAHYDFLNVNISGGKIESTGLYPVRIYGPVATAKIGDSKINITGGELVGVIDPAREALVEKIICLGGDVTADTLYHTEVNVEGEGLPTVHLAAKAQ